MLTAGLILLVVSQVAGLGLGFTNRFAGPYVAEFELVDPMHNVSRDMADWDTYIRRVNRHLKTVTGWFQVKKPVHDPVVHFESSVWMNNKYVKLALDFVSKMSLCDEQLKEDFYYPVFNERLNWTSGEHCVMYPGRTSVAPDQFFDLDTLVHKRLKTTFYGRFKVITTIKDRDNAVVAAITWVVVVRKPD